MFARWSVDEEFHSLGDGLGQIESLTLIPELLARLVLLSPLLAPTQFDLSQQTMRTIRGQANGRYDSRTMYDTSVNIFQGIVLGGILDDA